MTIETAIKLAIEGGWKRGDKNRVSGTHWNDEYLLDRDFWIALGKGMGWNIGVCDNCGIKMSYDLNELEGLLTCPKCRKHQGTTCDGLCHWHRLIDFLADGGTPEKWFESLEPK